MKMVNQFRISDAINKINEIIVVLKIWEEKYYLVHWTQKWSFLFNIF